MREQLEFDMGTYKKYVSRGFCSGAGDSGGQVCVEVAVSIAAGLGDGDCPNCVHPLLNVFSIRLNDAKWMDEADRASGLARLGIAQLGTTYPYPLADASKLVEFYPQQFIDKLLSWTINVSLSRMFSSVAYLLGENKALLDFARRLESCRAGDYEGLDILIDLDDIRGHTVEPAVIVRELRMLLERPKACLAKLGHINASATALASTAVTQDTILRYLGAPAANYNFYKRYMAEQAVQLLIEMETPGSKLLGLL